MQNSFSEYFIVLDRLLLEIDCGVEYADDVSVGVGEDYVVVAWEVVADENEGEAEEL